MTKPRYRLWAFVRLNILKYLQGKAVSISKVGGGLLLILLIIREIRERANSCGLLNSLKGFSDSRLLYSLLLVLHEFELLFLSGRGVVELLCAEWTLGPAGEENHPLLLAIVEEVVE